MIKIKKRPLKLTGQFTVLLLTAVILGAACFSFLWVSRLKVFSWIADTNIFGDGRDVFKQEFMEKAPEINIKDEKNKISKEFLTLVKKRDKYTGVSIYDEKTGKYIAGYYPKTIELFTSELFQWANDIDPEQEEDLIISFKDRKVQVILYSCHTVILVIPWLIMCGIISVLIILLPILWFVKKKIKLIRGIQDAILVMSEGDLSVPLEIKSTDEIGILAGELNKMRIALDENIRQEEESRKANRDLITAMSHDLRTPLTTLNGYLEIIRLNRSNQEQYDEFLDRCIRKVDEIKEMSNKMFEYSLVFEQDNEVEMEEVPIKDIEAMIRENVEFTRVVGFDVRFESEGCEGGLMASPAMLRRIMNNLFSNVIKYGDKGHEVLAELRRNKGEVVISLINKVKKTDDNVESNHIGLKSVEKMVRLHNGILEVVNKDCFQIRIVLPIY